LSFVKRNEVLKPPSIKTEVLAGRLESKFQSLDGQPERSAVGINYWNVSFYGTVPGCHMEKFHAV
jgi:hypothetical protein